MARKYKGSLIENNKNSTEFLELEQIYIFSDLEETKEFLESNSELKGFLKSAYVVIKKYFPEAKLLIRLAFPHLQVKEQQLILAINSDIDRSEALKNFNNLRDFWWQGISQELKIKIAFSLESSGPDSGSLYDLLEELAGTYDGPEDWSTNSSRYLHGSPKR